MNVSNASLSASIEADWPHVVNTIAALGPFVVVSFEDTIDDPRRTARQVGRFLGLEGVDAMATVVERRTPRCLPNVRELDWVR
jgi:hypothetical protein